MPEFRNNIALVMFRVYLIMQIAENGTLLDYVRDRKFLEENQARNLFKQLINAIEYIHSKGVVHRLVDIYIYRDTFKLLSIVPVLHPCPSQIPIFIQILFIVLFNVIYGPLPLLLSESELMIPSN